MSLEAIFKRRSIRKFKPNPVEPEKIRHLLEAAMAAPSANNRQPWHFVVVTGRETLNRLAQAHPYGKMLSEATLAIAVCGDPEISEAYWIQDCSAATENILIAAAALGLGSVWLGCTPRRDRDAAVRNVLGIPENRPVLSLIAIGHPDEHKESRTQYDEKKVHRESW
ncbi:nitroreductase family protein [bacterium]|nr:nitroreductase family protein [candidate division CSSED10-310 bacterium]